MKYIARIAFITLTVAIVLSTYSFGCSLVVTPMKAFDTAEYVFIGEVLGHVGPFRSQGIRGEAWGLQVKADEIVYAPKKAAEYFEVIPYGLWPDCSSAGTSREELAKYYPAGTKVKVIAKEAKLLPGMVSNGNLRLEDRPGERGGISRNSLENGRQMTSALTVFDYQSYKVVSPAERVSDFMPFLDARVALPQFELRKDLNRLQNARSEEERVKVLERLVYYPGCCDFDFYKISEDYVKDLATLRGLHAKRDALDGWLKSPGRK